MAAESSTRWTTRSGQCISSSSRIRSASSGESSISRTCRRAGGLMAGGSVASGLIVPCAFPLRQGEVDRRAGVDGAFRPHLAVVAAHHPLYGGEADAGAFELAFGV